MLDSDITSHMEENDVVVVIMPNEVYMQSLLKTTKNISEKYNKILYVAANKPYEVLAKDFLKKNIDENKFYFIDCISGSFSHPTPKENVVYLADPSALTELTTLVTSTLKTVKPEVFIIDSPTSFAIHSSPAQVIRFMHFLITKIEVANCKIILPCLYDEENPMFLKDMEMFSDEVIDLRK